MKKNNINCIIMTLCFCLSLFIHTATAGVLHWLSQVESDVGPIINNTTSTPKISTNGRYVTFSAAATNLFPDDNNSNSDVLLKDLLSGQIQVVTLLASGQQFNGYTSQYTAPTSNGRYVVFVSSDDELPNGVGSGEDYIYLKDLVTGSLSNLSEYEPGMYFDLIGAVHLSDDAQFITFSTYHEIDPLHTDFARNVYRKDLNSGTIELLSIAADGTEDGNDDSTLLAVSDNNRYVLFYSDASNLTLDVINNNRANYFLRDTSNDTTVLINITPSGLSSAFDNLNIAGDVSNTGSVIFSSTQSDLVINDTNNIGDVFHYTNGNITRITMAPNGNQLIQGFVGAVVISGDGTRLLFRHSSAELVANDNNNNYDVFSYQVANSSLSLVSKNAQSEAANSSSNSPAISLDGNRAVFSSSATDLITAPSSPIHEEVFVHQFSSQSTQKVTIPTFNPDTIIDRIPAAYGSSDQQTVIYSTRSNNLTDDSLNLIDHHVYLLDRVTNKHQLIVSNGVATDISPSGQYVTFYSSYAQPEGVIDLGATNIFLLDRNEDSYTQIDEGYSAKVNDDGHVVFASYKAISSDDLNTTLDVYYFNSDNQSISLISYGMDGLAATASDPDIGGSGSNTWVVFSSSSDLLTPADTNGFNDVFMKKIPAGAIFRISQTTAGLEGSGPSYAPSISSNGNYVTFMTYSDNLTSDDYSNAGGEQILHYDRSNTALTLASKNDAGLPLYSEYPSLYLSSVSDSGRYVAYKYEDFSFNGIDFIGDDDGLDDVVLFDMLSQTGRIISKTAAGQNSFANAGYNTPVMEDLSVSPPLVGVLFTARSPADLTGLSHHPGHEEAFLYQQGGPDVNLSIQVIGLGQVNGTSSTSCQTLCDFSFALGTTLTLAASPDPGMVFQGWQVDFGSCNNDINPCELIMDRSKILTAVFVNPNDVIFATDFE